MEARLRETGDRMRTAAQSLEGALGLLVMGRQNPYYRTLSTELAGVDPLLLEQLVTHTARLAAVLLQAARQWEREPEAER